MLFHGLVSPHMSHHQVQTGMDKASRLVFGDSLMTHAMVLTGCHVEGSSVTRCVVVILAYQYTQPSKIPASFLSLSKELLCMQICAWQKSLVFRENQ